MNNKLPAEVLLQPDTVVHIRYKMRKLINEKPGDLDCRECMISVDPVGRIVKLATVRLPVLACQPALAGLSDITGITKKYLLQQILRPIFGSR